MSVPQVNTPFFYAMFGPPPQAEVDRLEAGHLLNSIGLLDSASATPFLSRLFPRDEPVSLRFSAYERGLQEEEWEEWEQELILDHIISGLNENFPSSVWMTKGCREEIIHRIQPAIRRLSEDLIADNPLLFLSIMLKQGIVRNLEKTVRWFSRFLEKTASSLSEQERDDLALAFLPFFQEQIPQGASIKVKFLWHIFNQLLGHTAQYKAECQALFLRAIDRAETAVAKGMVGKRMFVSEEPPQGPAQKRALQ